MMSLIKMLHGIGKSHQEIRNIWFGALTVVVLGNLLPQAGHSAVWSGIEKALHFALYGLLAGCPMILFRGRKMAILLAVATAPLGCILEMGQTVITGHIFSAGNLLANNAGVFIGLAVGATMRLKKHYARGNSSMAE
jgi:hypothetical protein